MGTISRLVMLDLLEMEPCGWYHLLPHRRPAASPGIAPDSWL